jgi:N-acetylglutamate synthase-like GNAT family acetyltransferase
MATVTQVNARILELIDKGYESTQIVDILREEEQRRDEPKDEVELFPDAIRIAAQALAFRQAVIADAEQIYELLKEAYKSEVDGPEASLTADSKSSITKEDIVHYIEGQGYQFLLTEAPNGYGIESDGRIIGACCFSTDGESKRNGIVEGKLASVRYIGVLRQYQHCLVGARLLQKAETESLKKGCCRMMICIPSTRVSLGSWLERRDYFHGIDFPYPKTLQHTLINSDDIKLHAYLKELSEPKVGGTTTSNPSKSRKHMSPIWRMTSAAAHGDAAANIPDVD